MDWQLFWISSALCIFFSEHVIWLKRFEAMADLGTRVPNAFLGVSKGISMITMFNLVVFMLVYGFKVSWLWSPVIVIGGYATGIAYVLLTGSFRGMIVHKIGWLGMPLLSGYIWFVAFAA